MRRRRRRPDVKPGSIRYEDIAYPYPVSYLPLVLYGQDVRMAYMDVPPSGQPNGRTVVLFHGMNFGGFYFAGPIEALRKEGFRVVVPDQIGFGRSSKPIIPYNFHDMALNSRRLLAVARHREGVDRRPLDGRDAGRAVRRVVSGHHRARRDLRSDRADRHPLRAAVAQRRRGVQGHHGADQRPALAGILREHPALLPVARRVEAGV